MRERGPASVSLIVCESVLNEKTESVSAIRIMDVLAVGPLSTSARFFVVTYLHSRPLDFGQHVAKVQLAGLRGGQWISVAEAPPTTSRTHTGRSHPVRGHLCLARSLISISQPLENWEPFGFNSQSTGSK